MNGLDITRRPRDMWIIDFGVDMPSNQAALYEAPFEYVREHVRPQCESVAVDERMVAPRATPRGDACCAPRARAVYGTLELTKHRLFVWLSKETLPDHQLIAVMNRLYFWPSVSASAHGLGLLCWARCLLGRRIGCEARSVSLFSVYLLPVSAVFFC